jgi:hypothetical protein
MPRLASMAPAQTAMPSGACSSMRMLASRPPSTSSTPSTIAPHAMDPSKASLLHGAGTVKTSSSIVPTGAHRTLSAIIAMVLVTSSVTTPARNPTLLQLTEVM